MGGGGEWGKGYHVFSKTVCEAYVLMIFLQTVGEEKIESYSVLFLIFVCFDERRSPILRLHILTPI